MDCESMLIWNVRGLISRVRRDMALNFVSQHRVSLLCLQETKVSVVDDLWISNTLGSDFAYVVVPAIGSSGGILVAWRVERWVGTLAHPTPHDLMP
jgi:exonuclease III